MRIAILSGGEGWHVKDLERAASDLQCQVQLIDIRRIQAGIGSTRTALAGFDAVLVRTMPPGSLEQVIFRMDVLHLLRERGVPLFNPPRTLEICVDKYLASAKLEQAGLAVPRTIVCQDAQSSFEAFAQLGGDVVVKPLFGSEGRGMMRLQDPDLACRAFQTLERLGSVTYLQEFIRHPGWDLRAFVLDGKIIAAMRRYATDGWRTNVAQGGRAEICRLSSREEEAALRAANSVEAIMAGIDLLPGPDGRLYVLEVNAVPGWRALSRVTGIDVASLILQAISKGCHRLD
jgi:ribosomal protein S6--L-glutamate ligase